MPKKSKGKLKSQNDRKQSSFAEAEVFRNSAAVLDDTDPHEALKYMKEIFGDKLDEDVILMIFSECAYDVDQAFETLMSLCNEDNEKDLVSSQVNCNSECGISVNESASLFPESRAVSDYSFLENFKCPQSLAVEKNFEYSSQQSCNFHEEQNDEYSRKLHQDAINDTSQNTSLPESSLSLFKTSSACFNDTFFSPKYFIPESSSSESNAKDSISNPYVPSSVPQFITPLLPTPIYKFGSPVYQRSIENENRHFQSSSEKIHTSAVSLNGNGNRHFQNSSERIHTSAASLNGNEKKKDENLIKNVVQKIKVGHRILIILRGLPGSGKSTLGRKLKFSGVVYSTDDFFYKRGKFIFDSTKLSVAHEWNKRRTKKALERGITPVIIDNTNTEAWEMSPYVFLGRKFNYEIFILEPNTPWKFNVRELYFRNRHGVSKEKIAQMKERYQHNITVENMIKSLNSLNMEDSKSANSYEVTSENDSKSDHEENKPGFTETENFSLEEAVVHEKPLNLDFNNESSESWISELPVNGSFKESDLLSANVEFVCHPFVSKQRENFTFSNINSQSENNEKLEGKEVMVIGNLDELKALMCEDSEDSQSHNDSTSDSTQDIACWEAITEHCDDFLWSASSEDNMNVPYINDQNVDVDSSGTNDIYKNMNIIKETSTQLNSEDQVQEAQNSHLKDVPVNEMLSEEKLNIFENSDSCSVDAVSSQSLSHSSPKYQSEKCARNHDYMVKHLPLKRSLFSYSEENASKSHQSSFEIPDNKEDNHDTTTADTKINKKSMDVKCNSSFSLLATSWTENDLKDLSSDTKFALHKYNDFPKQDINWDLGNCSNDDNNSKNEIPGVGVEEFDIVCPKPQRNETVLNTEFCFSFNKKFNKDDHLIQFLDSANSPGWEASEFDTTLDNLDFESKNSKDELCKNTNHLKMMLDMGKSTDWEVSQLDIVSKNHEDQNSNSCLETGAPLPKHQRELYENDSILYEKTTITNNQSSDENIDENLTVQPIFGVRSYERKIYAKISPFLEQSVCDVGNDWEFPDYIKSDIECSDEHESIILKTSSSTQTEPNDFVLLYKITKGGDFTSDYPILKVKQRKEIPEFTDVKNSQNLEFHIFSKAPKFEKSTSTDDMLDDIEIEQKLYQLHECFPDISEEDLKHLLEMCHNNDTWLSNLLLEWGYKYNVTTPDSIHSNILLASSNEDAEKKCCHVSSGFSVLERKHKEINLESSETVNMSENVSSNQKSINESKIKNNSISETKAILGNHDKNNSESKILSDSKSLGKLQLILDPAFAFQLQEMFGAVVSRDHHDTFLPEDRCVDIDFDCAKLIYSKWKETVHEKMKVNNAVDVLANGGDLSSPKCKEKFRECDRSASSTRNGSEPLPLSEIMDMEYALQLHKQEKLNKDTDFATKLKRLELYNMFPGADTVALDEIFESNNFSLKNSIIALGEDIGQPENVQKEEAVEKIDRCVAEWRESNCFQDFINDDWKDWVYKEENIGTIKEAIIPFSPPSICPEALKLREIAAEQYHLRQEFIRKAQAAYCRGMKDVASFYAQQGKEHGLKFKEANKEASELIARQRNSYTPALVLDLHGLYVQEAIPALEKFLRERKLELKNRQQTFPQTISIITGQGIHSMRGPKLRPSVIEFLKKTGYRFTETNPGMVEVTIIPE